MQDEIKSMWRYDIIFVINDTRIRPNQVFQCHKEICLFCFSKVCVFVFKPLYLKRPSNKTWRDFFHVATLENSITKNSADYENSEN